MTKNPKGKVVPLWEDNALDENGVLTTAEQFKNITTGGPRPFPVVSSLPRLPVMIPDEILDYYGWVFCQGGFLNMHMTFEQFLMVIAAVSPSGLSPEYDSSDTITTVGHG